jgi:hypothetical protein
VVRVARVADKVTVEVKAVKAAAKAIVEAKEVKVAVRAVVEAKVAQEDLVRADRADQTRRTTLRSKKS